jgi:hypothetical protein
VVRVNNDFAAGIVLAGHNEPKFIDEGLATSIGRPKLVGNMITWRHGTDVKSSPIVLADRCPPAPVDTNAPYPVLANAEAFTHRASFCLRATGALGHLDGDVVQLRGSLAVIRRAADVRVVDLHSQATIAGPVPGEVLCGYGSCYVGVGSSGTLIYRRPQADQAQTQLIVAPPGKPERILATGDIGDVRYEDGVLRYFVRGTGLSNGQQITQAIP